MTYKSLFDIIELTKEFQVYEGNLEAIFSDITRILAKKKKTKRDYSILAFQSPRIIRALIDYKDKHPDDIRILELLRDGIAVALNIYKQYGGPTIIDEILELKREIVQLNEDILQVKLQQHPDFINLLASKPELSRETARKLYDLVGSENAIMLAIGHGAINISMDVILRYEDLSHKKNVLFYPVRFSRTKHKKYEDTEPRLTPGEINYLQEQAIGRKIIIFDENYNTGKTMNQVLKFISENVFRHHKIDILYNVNTSNLGN